MKRNKENKRPWTYRFMSVVLACAMLFTSSGFQTLAQEASTEIQTESAEEIAARQAAQQAQEAAAQQAAAEEAARQAEAQAQAAAAQQAAEEEAARQAEAQAQAEAAQQAAEEESARKAAEAAAAQQAAEDANTARQQQQQAAVQSQGNYVSSVEQVPVIAGRLVLNVDAASTQEAGKAAKISVVYGLGSECTLGSVDTRLYVWNKNAAFPQFINGVYTDPISKRIFTLKTDEEGDTYISYSLKPGESFKQIFELTDTTVAAGGSVVFDVAICAMGQIPTDSQIQQTVGKVTYALPAEETQPVAGESQPATEEMQQAAGDSQPVTEESEQYVTIELPEEGTSDTSSTERADTNTSNGISAEESLIDIVLPGLEDEETGAGTEAKLEAETETESEIEIVSETEAESETESEAETESETEAESETEIEVEYGTNFTYSDGNVTVTAVAAPEANIPADAQLKADRVPVGSARYNEAIALMGNHLEVPEGYEAVYEIYDVYFLVDGEEVEPEDGLVTVTMEFATPVFEDAKEVGEDYSVWHISDENVVSEVTDSVDVNENGSVNSVGFTADSFSLDIVAAVMPLDVDTTSDYSLDRFIYEANIYTKDSEGAYTDHYDPGETLEKGGSFELEIKFKEIENGGVQFPVLKDSDGNILNETTDITYQLSSALITGFLAETGEIQLKEGTQWSGSAGTYTIEENGKVTLHFNSAFLDQFTNVEGSFRMEGKFSKNISSSQEKKTINITDKIGIDVKFADNPLAISKTISSYDAVNEVFHYTITLMAYGDINSITVTDTLQSNLELQKETVSVEPKDSNLLSLDNNLTNENQLVMTGRLDGPGEGESYKEYTITYDAKIRGEALKANGIISNLSNTVIADIGDDNVYKDTVNPSYSHFWVDKSNGEYEDGHIKWIIRVNENGDQDAEGIKVTDTLKSEYMRYDTSTEMVIYRKTSGGESIKYAGIDLDDILSEDKTSWSYTIKDNGKYEYEFVYYTYVDAAHAGSSDIENSVVVEKNGESYTENGSYNGEGTGTGTGKIAKDYKGTVIEDGVKYALWETTVTVPNGGLDNVVFYDELQGDHILPDKNEDMKLSFDGYSGRYYLDVASDRKSFSLYFGVYSADEEKSKLENNTGADYTIKISYRTKILVEEGKDQQVGNTAYLTANGKTDISVVPKQTVVNYIFYKNGLWDGSSTITWRITLDAGKNGGVG